MNKFVQHLRDSRYLSFIYTFLVFLCSVWGIMLLILRISNSIDILNAFVSTMMFFTTQSNILVLIVTLLFLLKFDQKNWFKYLSFIGLVNIFITALIFNTLLGPFMDHVDLIQYVLHIIVPVMYSILYFVFMPSSLHIKHFFVGIIYPVIYVILVYIVIEPFLGRFLIHALDDFDGSRFVYPFLDPSTYSIYPQGTMLIFFIILGISLFGITFLLNFFKIKIEEVKLDDKKQRAIL